MKKRTKIFLKTLFIVCFFVVLSGISTVVVKAQTGWGQDQYGYYYMVDDNTKAKNWYQVNGSWYYFGSDGIMRTGWQEIGGKWYYFSDDGAMRTGWQEISGEWYYLYSNGEMLTGWQKVGDNWYYLNKDGRWIDNNSAETNTIKGIDVSKWQGDIDWNQVKNAGIEFSFIRIGHGNRSLDKYYISNMQEANAVEMPVGVYFYSTATTEEQAVLDAQFVIENLQGYWVSYPVVIDLEDSSQVDLGKDKITDIAIAFCDEIRAAGYTPMVYCNENWYRNYIDFSRLDNVERWIARYNVMPSSTIERGIWQCGSTGRIPGINGNVDTNFGYKDYTQIVTKRNVVSSSYSKATGVWKENSVGKWYQYLEGGYPANEWEKIRGKWYWFNEDGYMETGWQRMNGTWYYLNADGAMTTGWQKIDGFWYYLGSVNDGAMKTGWQKIGTNWYYLESNGMMQVGWKKIDGYWYYLGATNDGAMKTGWQRIENKWYYMYGDGRMAADTWIGSYYVNSSGVWVQ